MLRSLGRRRPMRRTLTMLLLAIVALPAGVAWAAPITWVFSGELLRVQLGTFDPGFRAASVVDGQVVRTPFSGSLHFDPAEADFWFAEDSTGTSRPGATECLISDNWCGYHVSVRFEITVGGHELDGEWTRENLVATPGSADWNLVGSIYDGNELGPIGISLYALGGVNHVLPAETFAPPAIGDPAGNPFGLVFY